MSRVMICPNDFKKNYLLEQNHNQELEDIKFYSKNDYFNHLFFSYDEKTIYYLMKNYSIPYRTALEYLQYLYVIEDKKYNNKKLTFLSQLKQELIQNHLLTFNPFQKDSVEVKHIYDLDLYEEKALNTKVDVEDVSFNIPVYEFNSMEEEVHYVCVEIRKLFKKGISLSSIFLCNVNEEYYYILDKFFSYYDIPIEIPFKNSIYSNPLVQNYLKTGEIDLENMSPVNQLLIRTINSLVDLEDDDIKKEIMIEELKHTYLPNPKYREAVTIKNIKDTPFQVDQYVFLLGFNEGSIPSVHKDIEYITDQDKSEVDLYPTNYLNHREKRVTAYLLSKIPNLTITYKLSSPFNQYYPSVLIDEYRLEVIREEVNDIEYSNLYNKIRLGEKLDNYYLYGEKDGLLEQLNGYYEDYPYNEYHHRFSGINNDLYLQNLSYPLKLSYTSLNSYNECKFKYYCNYVLKLGEYEQTFAALIGSLYHEILSLYKKNDFNLDEEWNKYLEQKDLSLKDMVLLVRIRKDLEELIKVLKQQQEYTKFDTEYYEKPLKVKIRDDISVEFIGYIDKIMTYQNISDTYFSIVDYKTGTIDTHIEPMKYGLHMQLPIYLYLINKDKLFESPIFTGIYYQNILFSYPTWSKNIEKEKKDNYKLKGYSTDHIEHLSLFDSTYKDSLYIKSMKYSDKFDRYSKVLSDEDIYNITNYTDKIIKDTTNSIIDADFAINPKVYNKENVSCEYCTFKDLCFVKDSDVTYLPKVEDFSFLEDS